jgi:hypothetical protein
MLCWMYTSTAQGAETACSSADVCSALSHRRACSGGEDDKVRVIAAYV